MGKHRRQICGGLALVLGVLLITLGTIRMEPDTVLQKAVNICMECIGIG